MATVVWTPRASEDLESIGEYYAQSAPGYAIRLVRKLLHVVGRLEAFPESGRVVPEIGDDEFREVIHRNYRIVYMYWSDSDRVEILAVFHASKQFGALGGESNV